MAERPTATLPSNTETTTVVSVGATERRRATYTGPINPDIQSLYSIVLIDVSNNQANAVINPGLDPASRTSAAEYFFTVPPQQYDMSEPFATQVIATQNGGKFVETHGSLLKMIRVSGTTGIRPNPSRRALANVPIFGGALNQVADDLEVLSGQQGFLLQDRTIPPEEATGFDDIIFMRNIFRFYSDLKENAPNASKILMLWRNAKDADYWVVEPMDFRLARDSSSPLTYKYNISLKALTRFTTRITFPDDPLQSILSTQRFFSRVQEYNNTLKSLFLVASAQRSRLEALGVFATTQILTPVVNMLQGLALLKSTSTGIPGERAFQAAQDLFNNIDDALNTLQGTSADPGFTTTQSVTTVNVDDQDDLVRSLRRSRYTAARILTEGPIRDNVGSRSSPKLSRVTQAYNASGGGFTRSRRGPVTGGSSAFIGNEGNPNSVGQGTVHTNEDIRAIAARLLGDRLRWQILVILNNLEFPYISSSSNPDAGVLGPGDTILYPLESSQAVAANTIGRTDPSTYQSGGSDANTLGPIQQAYGRDLRLRSVPAAQGGGLDLTDVVIGQNGDLSTIVGIPNVDQAIRIKFLTERGELPAHPLFGARFPIGSKMTPVAFNEYRIETEATLYSDSRIRRVRNLQFTSLADILSVSADVELLNASDTLDASIALRTL